ncbi:MAG: glutathione S-transferase family protein [Candidatus Lambdaproteobacteria bacterium]|nr:glutathione S-transferase family protein [Candidatus Lambdaproteobacteria bacterium]
MKLHMHKVSTTCRPILQFVAENKLDVEMVVVDLMTGEHLKEPFTRLNPNKLVPVLEDGDFILTESSTILKYLAEKFGSPAYPKDLKQRAKVNEVMDWFNTTFYREYGYHMVYPQVYPHHVRQPETANTVTVDWGKGQAGFLLDVLDKHWLGPRRNFVAGDKMTIADFFGAGLLTCGDLIGVNYKHYPNTSRWLSRMQALPSWGAVNDVHNGFAESLKAKQFVTIK